MAGLRVFVSSTCFDLSAHRSQIRNLLLRMGYDPVMSEHSDVLFDHRVHTHTSCVKEVPNADMVILLIGPRFGGTVVPEALSEIMFNDIVKASSKTDLISDQEKLSITQVEVMKAIENEIPLFTFVDAKVHHDHHLYQLNKKKHFASEITYPSIQKPETARYIFEFINLITHRFSNNAVVPYHSFSDIEDHLVKQWSMMFQRLLREERDKSVDARRADLMIEQLQDLKAAVLQSITAGSGREIARSVLKYRRLADFLLAIRFRKPGIDFISFTGTFEELLQHMGVVKLASATDRLPILRTILVLADQTYIKVRIPPRRFSDFQTEWLDFSSLDRETKVAVLDGVAEVNISGPPLVTYVAQQFEEEEGELDPEITVLDIGHPNSVQDESSQDKHPTAVMNPESGESPQGTVPGSLDG